MIDISIIIVSYNSLNLLLLTLSSVRRAMEGLEAEVFVVDNASQEPVADTVRAQYPWVKLIAMSENGGFSKANNVAMSQATGRTILILNPDTIVPHDFLRNVCKHVESHPEGGAMGVRMVNGCGDYLRESKRGYTDLATSFFKLTCLWKLAPHSAVLNAYYVGQYGEKDICPAPVLSGACMAFSHEVMDRVGGFDPCYFMYSEDIDLSWRMHKSSAGGNTYRGDLPIIHFKGQSTPRRKEFIGYFYESMLLFAQKYEAPKHGVLVNGITKLGIKAAYYMSLLKCVVMRYLERQKTFVQPVFAVLVSDNVKHVMEVEERCGRIQFTHLRWGEIGKLVDLRDNAVVVFDASGDVEAAIEAMSAHGHRFCYGFYNPDTRQSLVFYNNRTHELGA